jgi:hypothetical protein
MAQRERQIPRSSNGQGTSVMVDLMPNVRTWFSMTTSSSSRLARRENNVASMDSFFKGRGLGQFHVTANISLLACFTENAPEPAEWWDLQQKGCIPMRAAATLRLISAYVALGHLAVASKRWMPSGVASPTYSARCQPFLRSVGLSNPRRYESTRRRGSGRAKR